MARRRWNLTPAAVVMTVGRGGSSVGIVVGVGVGIGIGVDGGGGDGAGGGEAVIGDIGDECKGK